MTTFLEIAERVLGEVGRPMSSAEIWDHLREKGYDSEISQKSATPKKIVYISLFNNTQEANIDKSKFSRVGSDPIRWGLKTFTPGEDDLVGIDQDFEEPAIKYDYTERDIHPLLTYFGSAMLRQGRTIHCKTIFHEKSLKLDKRGTRTEKGLNTWVHPDMVGVYGPFKDWNETVFDLNKALEANAIDLFSFELKLQISARNYREYFFQAVSNSSWANESYLVATEIDENETLLEEIKRLSNSFGIGIIRLDLDDFNSSQILFPARKRPNLDWDVINKLTTENDDFLKFIKAVKDGLLIKHIETTRFDPIIEDPYIYIKEILSKGKRMKESIKPEGTETAKTQGPRSRPRAKKAK
jgi:hypothetical protein